MHMINQNYSQTLRQLKILQFINQHESVSKRQLVDRFRVSGRTITHDIGNLMEVYPIYHYLAAT